ncbi:hypothetical protein NQ317_018073 [Molorchus minor]|uniref:Suppressor of cytokine signaling 6 n=1 Tax=Molorchus minor TaxID=1323400 RepID=A0ABQ9JGN6_9CUCU|nr:hypothetical protein NQ317_018073 [Molorchus minor]
MASSDTNKTKSWIYRLRHLKIRRRSVDNINNEDLARVVYRRSLSSYDTDNANNSSTHISFRKSLRKMHTRVKNVFRNSHNSKHTVHISSFSAPSHSQSRSSADYTSSNSAHSIETERRTFPQLSEIQNGRVPKNEVLSLSTYYWYWGPISRTHAEERLSGFPDGAFLIRDSSSDRYIFTMSFRSVGRTLHTRIELSKSGYSLVDQGGYHSIAELVNDALTKSKNGVYCYTKTRDELNPNYPVRLTLPVSRYDKVPSLKYLSRFVIRQYININDIEKLPLPVALISYLQENGPYF